ncbi:MAG: Ig-like domain-containing protein, partial [bacterium]|nr:Ig-like domain-containing protein [bacterium]
MPAKINDRTPFTAKFVFSEAVTGFAASDVTVTGGAKGVFAAASPSVYTLVVTPAGSANVVVTVAANAATDDGVNTGPAADVSATVVWDATAPTVAIAGVPAKISSRDPFTAKFTFSEGVTGFDAADVTVTGADKGTFTATSAAVYTLVVEPDGDEDVAVTVQANAASDGVNNGPASAVAATAVWDAAADTVPSGCTTGRRGCVWITGSSAIVEGGTATFTVHAHPAPRGALDVKFAVSETSPSRRSRFLRGGHRVPLTIPAGQTSVSYSVGTVDDGIDEDDGHVTATIRPGTQHPGGGTRTFQLPDGFRYTVREFYYGTIEPNQARVAVSDNDGAPPAPPPPAVSVDVSSASVSKGGYAHFCTSVDGFTKRTPAAHEPGIFNVELKVTTAGGAVAKAVSQQYRTGVTERMCSQIDTAPWAGETLAARVLTPGQRLHLGRNITPYVPGATSSATLTVGASPSGLSWGTGSRPVAEFRLATDPPQRQNGRLRTVNNLVNLNVDIVPAATSGFDLGFDLSGTATLGTDYTIPGVTGRRGTVAVPSGASRVTIPVTIIDDTHEDDGETVVLTLRQSGTYQPASPRSVTLTIRNDDPDPPPSRPVVTVAAGSAVTEGGDASFTLTATPAPAADLDVDVTVASDGDWGVTAGTRTVTIPATGTYTLTLSTQDDGEDEKDGSVSVTAVDGTGYTVGSSAAGSVTVRDDDAPPDTPDRAACQAAADRIVEARDHPTDAWAKGGGNAHHVAKWNRVLEAIGYDTGTGVSPMPAAEIHGNAAKWPGSTFKAASTCLKALEGSGPAITVAAGSAVTEGGSASFVFSASPAPASDLALTVTVATQGEYGITAGTHTVTIPTTGSHTLTLSTQDDSEDEEDGSVSVTVADGTGWTAGDPATASVTVRDDDKPVVTVSGGDAVAEGGSASFTFTATPAPAADLAVSVTVASDGDWGVTAGSRMVTIPATGSAALTLGTAGDDVDEPDGTVSVTVGGGTGYDAGDPAMASVTV